MKVTYEIELDPSDYSIHSHDNIITINTDCDNQWVISDGQGGWKTIDTSGWTNTYTTTSYNSGDIMQWQAT